MGVSVSDYALVMDKYEFSMKDLLERGPGEAYWIDAAGPGGSLRRASGVPESLTGIFTDRADSGTPRRRADRSRRRAAGSA